MSSEVEMNGVDIVLARMDTHPEEFYGDSPKWTFIYKDYFRDCMTEVQKGQIFEKIKRIRMTEFNQRVLTTLTDEEDNEKEDEEFNPFGSAPMKREGSTIRYNTKGRYKL